MPGDNCSILGCSVSRHLKYKGISLFKVPSGNNEWDTKWRKELINVITKDRVIDASLKSQIESRKLFICERHFSKDQFCKNESRASLVPGSIPTLNLPIKSIQSTSTLTKTPRLSATSIEQKREMAKQTVTLSASKEIKCYQSFSELVARVSTLKLNGWKSVSSESVLFLTFSDSCYAVPKYELYVDKNLKFFIRYLLWKIPVNNHGLFDSYNGSVENITISNLLQLISSQSICSGLSKQYAASCTVHSVPKVFDIGEQHSSPLHQISWYRSLSCKILISNDKTICDNCSTLLKRLSNNFKRREKNLLVPAKPKAPVSRTSAQKIKLTLQNIRLENKQLKEDILKMQSELSSKSVPVNSNLSNDLLDIMSNVNQREISPFMNLFWNEQKKYLNSTKKGVRYHPMIIKYCLGLAAKSSAMYDEIRFDDEKKTGFLILPSRRRLRDYKNYIRPKQGFNEDVIKELEKITFDFTAIEKYCILLIDEMKILENLVWDKHSGDLIGFVDLGDTEVNMATLENCDEIASHVLVFLVRSIVNPLKFTFANFATTNVKSTQLFILFWKAVTYLEDIGMKVVGVTSDGASANRSMYRMHLHMTRVDDKNENVDVTYRTLNRVSDEERYIYFISDPPHLIKTARNCLANSFSGRCTRNMWNDGDYMMWSYISKLFYDDLDSGLHLVPKLTNEHISLTPFAVMNVRLAAQVLSKSVSDSLLAYGPLEAVATAIYCQMFDNFFDCLNVRNTKEHITKLKPFLKPYESVNDERFLWLKETFLNYFADWKSSIDARPGQFTDNEKSSMFISWQTYEGIKMTVHSSVELIRFLLLNGVKYVLSEKFCQDPLENYFGQQRSMGRRRDNPTIRDFGFNDNTIRTAKIFRPIAGNCQSDDPQIAKIDVETMPARPRKTKSIKSIKIDPSTFD